MNLKATDAADTLNLVVLTELVDAFYAAVRKDSMLGDLFNRAIPDGQWPEHLCRITDFWSSVMLTSGRYHGNPVAAHTKHRHEITPAMFDRWLQIWGQTAEEKLPQHDAQAVIAKAKRIAESLQLVLFFRIPPDSPRAA